MLLLECTKNSKIHNVFIEIRTFCFLFYFQIEDFVEQHGPNLPDGFDTESATPLDYFWLMFPVRLIAMIVRYTNSYAAWKQAREGHDKYWEDVTEPEIRAFLAVNMVMGIQQLPQMEMYWSSDPFVGNTGIQQTMTCNRFVKISQYFHVSNREEEPVRGREGYDRLFKIREIMTVLVDTFMQGYTLGREVSVDEAMIRYSGRLSFRQYMPAKPIKRGVKVWMLCDSNNAYLSKFQFYLGKTNNEREHGLGHNVVTDITSHIQHTNRWIFFDNFFSGLPLLQSLIANGLYACGTIRINRLGFPAELKKPRDVKNRGDMKILQLGDSNVTGSAWMDKKHVHHVSTLSNPNDVRDANRRVNREVVQVQQPHSVWSYNKYMGGVDLHDQLRVNYNIGRNGKKWWKYLFWFLFNCAVVNSYIVYKEVSTRLTKKKRFRHVDFRVELQRQLIAGYAKRKRSVGDQLGQNFPLVAQENMGSSREH
ncbi:piggyBac transposable element-derived protein 4-like [Mercenaria mercenaria]|uniref:piggyBac transposable element-derived protein 4-like n=1 Tax=Mercenaria mercenaria TaxID=6596 RepID=UPI00234F8A0C|nr:piggyBac transposable element-derived protein 4-like [Mercenaria mercenaria]